MKKVTRVFVDADFVRCERCSRSIPNGSTFYVLTNRADEDHKYCPDCAAVIMAETLVAVSDTEFNDELEF